MALALKEKLIELVRSEPFLYDITHEDYMNKTLKDSIWERIAQVLKLKTGSEARTMWLKLRNCHRDALRRKIRKSDSATSALKPWLYERQMQFLLGYMNMSSGSITLENQDNGLYEDPDFSVYDNLEMLEDGEAAAEEPEEMQHFDETGESASNRLQIKIEPTKKLKADHVNEAYIKNLQQHQDKARERQAKAHPEADDDALFHFFMFTYNTVKNMPTGNQLRVKRKIFNTVTEEEDLLNSNGTMDQTV